jgi:hypothetical protein
MTARLFTFVIVCVAAATLSGCSTPSDEADPPSSSAPSRPPAPEPPEDRDEDAVMTALRQLDLCAVLETAMTATPGLSGSAQPRAWQPFACVVQGQRDQITAKVVSSIHGDRVVLPTRTIAGAKAYLREGQDSCTEYLPVSFELAIEFSQSGSESCKALTELVAASVAVLADPEAARVNPRLDACTTLAEALESDVDRSKLLATELDICSYLAQSREDRAAVSFDRTLVPSGRSRSEVVGGTQARIYEDDDACEVYWRQGPFASRYAATPDYPVVVGMPDCDRATELAESVIEVLAEPPPVGVAPQHPLLYAPDEPDSPLLGACAYVEDPGRCEPYREVPIPDDVTDASQDGHAMCAVSVDAVRQNFGPTLNPVVVSDSGTVCYFVEPERTVQVTFVVKPGQARGEPGDQEVTIAGRPGFVGIGDSFWRYQLSVDGDAVVVLEVGTGPVVASEVPLPAGTDKKADAVIAEVLRTYFS